MSAFIVSTNHIDYLVNAKFHWRNEGHDPDAMTRVAAMLELENRRSFAYRYREEMDLCPLRSVPYVGEVSAVQVLKALDCYEYQTCEHPEWEASEAHAWCERLRHTAGSRLPGYEEAQWEIR